MPQSNSSDKRSLMPQLTMLKNRAAWVGVSLTALGMLIAAIMYVTTALASTRTWAAEEDQATRSNIRAELKENYVDKIHYTKDITVLDERQQRIKDDVVDIKQMLKEVHDEMRTDRNSRNNRSYTRDNDTR